MVGLPLILFKVGDDMGDLEYIEGKVLASNYFQVSGDIDAITNTIEFIVPNGKTAFMIEAKITMKTNPSITQPAATATATTNDQVVAELKIDGTRKSKAKIGGQASSRNLGGGTSSGTGSGMSLFAESRFNVLGLSLVGDGAKKIEIENVLDAGSAFAEFSGYLV